MVDTVLRNVFLMLERLDVFMFYCVLRLFYCVVVSLYAACKLPWGCLYWLRKAGYKPEKK